MSTALIKHTWNLHLEHHNCPIFDGYWTFEFTNQTTGETHSDSTAEDCSEDEAIECAVRFFKNQTGLTFNINK